MNHDSKSPLKDKPLRHAGQSLEEERRNLIDDKVQFPVLLALMYIVLAGLEWWRYLKDSPPQPALATAVAVVAALFVGWRIVRIRPKLKALALGIEGEKAVGQFLERLREQGCVVFHDVVGTDFNIDHVVIGPAGVFTVETKTWRKPLRGDARIRFDGHTLMVGEHKPDRDPIVQARAQASWLRHLLQESTGKSFDTRPVVVFPGWFVESAPGSHKDLWVLEPKALPAFLENEPVRLTPEDVKLAAYHLSRHIRAGEAERARRR